MTKETSEGKETVYESQQGNKVDWSKKELIAKKMH